MKCFPSISTEKTVFYPLSRGNNALFLKFKNTGIETNERKTKLTRHFSVVWSEKLTTFIPLIYIQVRNSELILFFLKILFTYFREGKGEKHQCVVSHVLPTGYLAHNPGMCPKLGIKPATL